jgi:hypothetical protein
MQFWKLDEMVLVSRGVIWRSVVSERKTYVLRLNTGPRHQPESTSFPEDKIASYAPEVDGIQKTVCLRDGLPTMECHPRFPDAPQLCRGTGPWPSQSTDSVR